MNTHSHAENAAPEGKSAQIATECCAALDHLRNAHDLSDEDEETANRLLAMVREVAKVLDRLGARGNST